MEELTKQEEEMMISRADNTGEMEDFFETTEQDLDNFEEHSFKKGHGYAMPGFPEMEKKIEGLEAGMYLFAGESNSGKSAAMMNLLYSVCTHTENNLYGVYYTLDDSRNEIIPRIIAMNQSIPISVASKPQRYIDMIDKGEENSATYQDWLDNRVEGINKLKEMKNRFKIVDGNEIRSAEQLYDHMKRVKIYLEAFDPDCKMIVAIDSLNDLRFTSRKLKPGNELNSAIAREVKEWATEFDIPIFGSCHLRKLNGNRRPTVDDLKESVEYIYEASLVWLVHNDVSKNKESANVYYNRDDMDEKAPVLELDWAKNKKSSFKGRTYCYFVPEMSKLSECDKDAMKRFDALVYES